MTAQVNVGSPEIINGIKVITHSGEILREISSLEYSQLVNSNIRVFSCFALLFSYLLMITFYSEWTKEKKATP